MAEKHPDQPLVRDPHRVVRFKMNQVVQFLLDHGGFSMSQIRGMNFPREDIVQFYQLIGYSVSGFGDVFAESPEIYEPQDARVEAFLKAESDSSSK